MALRGGPVSRGGLLAAGALLVGSMALLGCAGVPDTPQASRAPAHTATLLVTPNTAVSWTPLLWPGKNNVAFEPTHHDGRRALKVSTDRSMSILRQRLQDAPMSPGTLRFSWQVSAVYSKADLGVVGQDDAPVRIVLAFDGDRSKLSRRTLMQSELSRALLGEDLPYATLTYVWCNTRPVGTVMVSPRTDRVRKIVVESGAQNVGRWRDYERNVAADFRRAFGEEPGPLIGIALMTDADNTGEQIDAWYGALRLSPP